jgi:hypothetical protein
MASTINQWTTEDFGQFKPNTTACEVNLSPPVDNKVFPSAPSNIKRTEIPHTKTEKKVKVKQSRYTPWRSLEGEEV